MLLQNHNMEFFKILMEIKQPGGQTKRRLSPADFRMQYVQISNKSILRP